MILEPLFNLVVSISTALVSTVFRYFFPKKENDEERSWKQYMIYTIYGIIGLSVLSITFLIHLGIGYFIHSGLSAGLRLQTEGLEFQVRKIRVVPSAKIVSNHNMLFKTCLIFKLRVLSSNGLGEIRVMPA